MEAASIDRSLDVFPLELLELRDRHQTLYGRAEAIEGVEVALPTCASSWRSSCAASGCT